MVDALDEFCLNAGADSEEALQLTEAEIIVTMEGILKYSVLKQGRVLCQWRKRKQQNDGTTDDAVATSEVATQPQPIPHLEDNSCDKLNVGMKRPSTSVRGRSSSSKKSRQSGAAGGGNAEEMEDHHAPIDFNDKASHQRIADYFQSIADYFQCPVTGTFNLEPNKCKAN
jgi:hypothetical protein